MKILLTLLAAVVPLFSWSQSDFAGNWEGTITQNEGGYRSKYKFEIYWRQKGSRVEGRSYVFVDNIHAQMELKGELLNETTVVFWETGIVDYRKLEGMEWCLKTGRLILQKYGEEWRLEGSWKGTTSFSNCIPGKVFLKKVIPRA